MPTKQRRLQTTTQQVGTTRGSASNLNLSANMEGTITTILNSLNSIRAFCDTVVMHVGHLGYLWQGQTGAPVNTRDITGSSTNTGRVRRPMSQAQRQALSVAMKKKAQQRKREQAKAAA